MTGENWHMTHPYGKNRPWRTLWWGLQRFWRGWDDTMADQALPWTLEFIRKTCEETEKKQLVEVGGFTPEEWHAELRAGARLAKDAAHAHRNEWGELGMDIRDTAKKEMIRSRMARKALRWWYGHLSEGRFEQW